MKAKMILAQATLSMALGIAASSASAIPLIFNFSGTVHDMTHTTSGQVSYDHSLDGQAFTGWIAVELDGLDPATTETPYTVQLGLVDYASRPAEWITSGLNIGGVDYDAGMYAYDGGRLAANDSKGQACPDCPYSRDSIAVMDASQELLSSAGFLGDHHTASLNLLLGNWDNPFDLIDLANGFEPLDVLTLPFDYTSLSFIQTTWTCGPSVCTQSLTTGISFLLDSLSIATGPPASNVPEPATIALFAVGLLGTAVARRPAKASR